MSDFFTENRVHSEKVPKEILGEMQKKITPQNEQGHAFSPTFVKK